MLCKACNTRVDQQRYCPNCGRAVRSGGFGEESHHGLGESSPRPLAPSSAVDFSEPEVELDSEVGGEALELDRSAPPSKVQSSGRKSAAAETPAPRSPGREAGGSGFTPQEVRALVAEKPGLLEPGLRLWRDRSSKASGAGYQTAVGDIDLLAQDDAGSLLVVMVADADAGKDLVGEVLQRMGWVRKHLAKEGQEVRGVVLLGSLPDELRYAAAAVSDTIGFKTWRVSLSFEPAEL